MNTTTETTRGINKPVYRLKQDADGLYIFSARGPEKIDALVHPSYYPDMQLLGWDRGEVLEAARNWLTVKGIVADVELV